MISLRDASNIHTFRKRINWQTIDEDDENEEAAEAGRRIGRAKWGAKNTVMNANGLGGLFSQTDNPCLLTYLKGILQKFVKYNR